MKTVLCFVLLALTACSEKSATTRRVVTTYSPNPVTDGPSRQDYERLLTEVEQLKTQVTQLQGDLTALSTGSQTLAIDLGATQSELRNLSSNSQAPYLYDAAGARRFPVAGRQVDAAIVELPNKVVARYPTGVPGVGAPDWPVQQDVFFESVDCTGTALVQPGTAFSTLFTLAIDATSYALFVTEGATFVTTTVQSKASGGTCAPASGNPTFVPAVLAPLSTFGYPAPLTVGP